MHVRATHTWWLLEEEEEWVSFCAVAHGRLNHAPVDGILHPWTYMQHSLDSVSYEKGGEEKDGEEEEEKKETKVVLGRGCDGEVQDEWGDMISPCIHGWDY